MARRLADLNEDFDALAARTLGIEDKLDQITILLTKQTQLQEAKLETGSLNLPSEAEPETEEPAPEKLTIAFVAKHISDNYHSRHLQERDRHELSILLRLSKYEAVFSAEDKGQLLSRLQLYAVVVTAGWKAAVSTSKRAELSICGIDLQAGDLAPQFNKQNYNRRRGNARGGRGGGRGRGKPAAS